MMGMKNPKTTSLGYLHGNGCHRNNKACIRAADRGNRDILGSYTGVDILVLEQLCMEYLYRNTEFDSLNYQNINGCNIRKRIEYDQIKHK